MINEIRENILIIDDVKLTPIFKMINDEGYKGVYSATTGYDALHIMNQHPEIKIAIVDLALPDSFDLVRQLKEENPIMEIICITDHATLLSGVKAIKHRVFSFIIKAVMGDELLYVLERCFDEIYKNILIAKLTGKIFIGYAHEDANRVEILYDTLKKASFSPWMDSKNIVPGEDWKECIIRAIKDSDFFLACLSKASVGEKGMIQNELRIAMEIRESLQDADARIIPVCLEQCDVPERLSNVQCPDIFAEEGWNQLVKSLRKGLAMRVG